LAELASQADLTVYIAPSDARQPVSATFEALPLKDGIQRLLQDKSYALIMAPVLSADGKPAGQRVAKIRVVSKGEAYTTLTKRQEVALASPENAAPQAPQDEDATVEQLKRDALEAPDAETRVAALVALASRQHEVDDLEAVVESAMRDAAPQVREVALGMLSITAEGPEALFNHIAAVARQDASPELRLNALTFLVTTQHEAVERHLQQALQDPDPTVRSMAQQLLDFVAQSDATPGAQPDQPKKK
jgi:hypothetical protein